MKLSHTSSIAVLAQALTTSATLITVNGNLSLPDTDTTVLGNLYNHWIALPNKTFDLTRSLVAPITSPLSIPMTGTRKTAIIEPSRSALVIIDMQNFFLHPELNDAATGGRTAVEPTLKMIDGFRSKGMKVLWTNWGLNERDLLEMPPALLDQFAGGTDSPLSEFSAYVPFFLVGGVEDGMVGEEEGEKREAVGC
jgi:hypothetical protein